MKVWWRKDRSELVPALSRRHGQGGAERHASWNELFFDLVVVAGIGQLAHLLHSHLTLGVIGLYTVLYLAFWTAWACFAVYGDIAAEHTRTRNLLLAMLGLAVMAASVPGILDAHASTFVIAYVALRWFAGRVWQRGEVVTDWPLIQFGAGSAPWLASLFVPAPWRYWLWAAGAVIDLTVLLIASSESTLRHATERFERVMRRRRPPPGRPPDLAPPSLQAVSTDSSHLAERLGLYVIIVLGEGLIQIIDATAEHEHWDLAAVATALGAFALLAAIWTLSVLYGFDGVPHLNAQAFPVRYAMLLHAAITAVLAALAAALGIAVAHAGGALPAETRLLLCGAMTLYFAIGMTAALPSRPGRAWLLGWALPCVLVPAVLAVVGGGLPTAVIIWALAATVAWQILYNPGPPGTTGRRPLTLPSRRA